MEKENTTSGKKITLQDIIEEGKKPTKLKIPDMGYIEYIMPTGKEVDELTRKVDSNVVLLREQHRTISPNIPFDESGLDIKKANMLGDLILWKGLNKADNTITQSHVMEMSNEIKTNLNLQISMKQMEGLDIENTNKLKNLLQMTKA